MIQLPSLSLRAVVALIGGLALLAALGWGLRVDHLRGTYKAKLIQVTGKLVAVTEKLNGFRAEIVDMTAQALERDRAHAQDVQARNDSIAREVAHDYEARIAEARARAAAAERRLRAQVAGSGGGGGAAAYLSGTGSAASGVDGEAEEAGFPASGLILSDALLCTEQAIQLDELISWVERTRGTSGAAGGNGSSGVLQQP